MAGGLGSRMRSAMPKHLHPILGRRMVDWIVEAARPLGAEPLVVVAAPDSADSFEGLEVAIQERPLGTGDAVRSARVALAGADEVLVLSGDTPLLTTALLSDLLHTHRGKGAAATVLSFVPADIRSYGRVVRNADGDLLAIVEAADASPNSSRSARRTRPSTSSRRTRSGPRSTASALRTPRASYTSPTPCAISSRRAGAWRCTSPPTPMKPKVSTRVSSWQSPRQRCVTGSTSVTSSQASRSKIRRRPGSNRPSSSSPTRRSCRSPSCREPRASRPALGSGLTPSPSTP